MLRRVMRSKWFISEVAIVPQPPTRRARALRKPPSPRRTNARAGQDERLASAPQHRPRKTGRSPERKKSPRPVRHFRVQPHHAPLPPPPSPSQVQKRFGGAQ